MIPLIISIWPYLAIFGLAAAFAGAPLFSRLLATNAKPRADKSYLELALEGAKQPADGSHERPWILELDPDEDLAFASDVAVFQALHLIRDHLSRMALDEQSIDKLVDPIAPLLFKPKKVAVAAA